MSLLDRLEPPILFAHRGASAHAPENTLAAFRLAVTMGAPAIELDAKLSSDGQVVVIHDPTVDRTTSGTGKVSDLSLTDLQSLDAGSWFNTRFQNERIPTLAEVFQAVGQQVFINVELTNYTTPRDSLPERVAEIVEEFALQERLLISSFHPINLWKIRRRLPGTPVGLLTLQGAAGSRMRGRLGRWFSPENLHPHWQDVTERFAEQERRHGRRLHVWTVNERAELARLKDLGVSGVFCDDPLLAQSVLEAA